MFRWIVQVAGCWFLLVQVVSGQAPQAQRGYPPRLPGAREEVYKQVGDTALKLYLFMPPGHQPTDRRAAVVFFFGGGWRSGTPAQFHEHCKYLAARGMVAITADYRVASRHGTKAAQCVEDAKSAIRWVRKEAERLGIDPHRIAAAGGSAGGHLAACTGVVPGFESGAEDASVSSVPNALVLFNPVLVLSSVDGQPPLGAEQMKGLAERMGDDPRRLSPWHHVKAGAPPTIIFHGKADTTVPYRTAELFTATMKQAGNDCVLVGFDGQPHGFFNFGRDGNKAYRATTRAMDEFFVRLGYVQGTGDRVSKDRFPTCLPA